MWAINAARTFRIAGVPASLLARDGRPFSKNERSSRASVLAISRGRYRPSAVDYRAHRTGEAAGWDVVGFALVPYSLARVEYSFSAEPYCNGRPGTGFARGGTTFAHRCTAPGRNRSRFLPDTQPNPRKTNTSHD